MFTTIGVKACKAFGPYYSVISYYEPSILTAEFRHRKGWRQFSILLNRKVFNFLD